MWMLIPIISTSSLWLLKSPMKLFITYVSVSLRRWCLFDRLLTWRRRREEGIGQWPSSCSIVQSKITQTKGFVYFIDTNIWKGSKFVTTSLQKKIRKCQKKGNSYKNHLLPVVYMSTLLKNRNKFTKVKNHLHILPENICPNNSIYIKVLNDKIDFEIHRSIILLRMILLH